MKRSYEKGEGLLGLLSVFKNKSTRQLMQRRNDLQDAARALMSNSLEVPSPLSEEFEELDHELSVRASIFAQHSVLPISELSEEFLFPIGNRDVKPLIERLCVGHETRQHGYVLNPRNAVFSEIEVSSHPNAFLVAELVNVVFYLRLDLPISDLEKLFPDIAPIQVTPDVDPIGYQVLRLSNDLCGKLEFHLCSKGTRKMVDRVAVFCF